MTNSTTWSNSNSTSGILMKEQQIYRIAFYNQGNIYELHARSVQQGTLYAFIEVEDIIFGERSSVVVDPAEERLKSEFQGVKRTYIPLQSVIRIDEVEREGSNRIIEGDAAAGTVMPFPLQPPGRKPDT
ncbi:MAG: DUF1820 family protein [Gammaproteobacteria bacterium]|jgi:hypothetical protein